MDVRHEDMIAKRNRQAYEEDLANDMNSSHRKWPLPTPTRRPRREEAEHRSRSVVVPWQPAQALPHDDP